jgi:hypothetical protein
VKILASLLIMLAFQPCLAQVQVETFVRPNQGYRELETLQFVLRVNGTQKLPVVALEGLENLRVVGGPSSGTNFTSINGRSQVSATLTWTLLPIEKGEAVIPAQHLMIDGNRYTSEAIALKIDAARSGPPLGEEGRASGGRRDSRGRTEPEILLQSVLAKSSVYVGEAVAHRLDVFSDVQLRDLQFIEEPDFADFWIETDPASPAVEPRRVERSGKVYLHYPFRLSVLVPNRVGTTTFVPYMARLEYRDPADRMRFFSFGSAREVVRRSESKTLEVKPLPVAGRPDDFDGSVGTFQVSARIDREQASVDDAIGLEVTVEGTGFLQAARPPEIPETPGLKVFPPKATESSKIVNGRLMSRKTWEWILVPLQGGELRLPQPSFSFFDPDEGLYRTEQASLPVLVVDAGSSGVRSTSGSGAVHELRRDVEFVKPRSGALRTDTSRIHQRSSFMFWLFGPLVLATMGIGFGRWRHHAFGDRARLRARRAGSEARRRLAAAAKHLEDQDAGTFHEGLSRALIEFIADRFDVEGAGLTYDRIDRLLEERGVNVSLREDLRRELEACDYARFVPSAGAEDSRLGSMKEAGRLIDEIERAL